MFLDSTNVRTSERGTSGGVRGFSEDAVEFDDRETATLRELGGVGEAEIKPADIDAAAAEARGIRDRGAGSSTGSRTP